HRLPAGRRAIAADQSESSLVFATWHDLRRRWGHHVRAARSARTHHHRRIDDGSARHAGWIANRQFVQQSGAEWLCEYRHTVRQPRTFARIELFDLSRNLSKPKW